MELNICRLVPHTNNKLKMVPYEKETSNECYFHRQIIGENKTNKGNEDNITELNNSDIDESNDLHDSNEEENTTVVNNISNKVINNEQIMNLSSNFEAKRYFGVNNKNYKHFIKYCNLDLKYDISNGNLFVNSHRFFKGKKLIQFLFSNKKTLPKISQIGAFLSMFKNTSYKSKKYLSPSINKLISM